VQKLRSLAGVVDFFVPAEVLSAVLLVFTMENILDHLFASFVPSGLETIGWVVVYILGISAVSGLNYITADEEKREDLSDDLEDL
jgi:hypothetical protein